MDVSPRLRPGDAVGTRLRPGRVRNVVALAVVVAALGFVLARGLGSATLYFLNVDEAVAKQDEFGARRFRIQGSVVPDTVARSTSSTRFRIGFNDVQTVVDHEGELPEMFRADIPVVLEGHWQNGTFRSDRMVVKHSEVYRAANPDRVDPYDSAPAAQP